MASELDIDVQRLKSEIKKTYASVSQEPEKDFIFPTGRAWAEDLDYPDELASGEDVLDIGCGAGTDTLVAAQMVAPAGRVTGIEMTPEMLSRARAAAAEMGATNVDLVEGDVEQLPFAAESFDVAISNGVIDLIPDKDAVFAEIFRVLRPGGRLQFADVTIQHPVSEEGRRDIDLWTG